MSTPAEDLTKLFGRLANDFQRDDVITAAANILLSGVLQDNAKLGGAVERLDNIHNELLKVVGTRYDDKGNRKVAPQIVLSGSLLQLYNEGL